MQKKQSSSPEPSFSEKVLIIALSIPEGRVTTYGRLAEAAGGAPILAQSITSILSKANKTGKYNIPYHRIVYSNGKVWIDEQNKKQRLVLYKREGIKLDENYKIINFKEVLL